MTNKIILKKKKAVLIGLNYPGQDDQLRGCINDVWRMKECLIKRYGFLEEDIVILIDTDEAHTIPTADNIRSALSSLIGSAKPGDVLFVHFSGHGNRVRADPPDSNDTGFIEFLVTAHGGCITGRDAPLWTPFRRDNDLKAFVDGVPRGCSITILADCCHSGGLIEGVKEQIGDSTKKRLPNSRSESVLEYGDFYHGDYSYVNYRTLPSNQFDILNQKTGEDGCSKVKFGLDKGKHEGHDELSEKTCELVEPAAGPSKNNLPNCGILFSACQSYQKAREVSFSGNSHEVCGVFTNAILTIVEETNGQVTNRELITKAGKILRRQGFYQKPGLYCSDHYVDAPFLCAVHIKIQRIKKRQLALLIFFFLALGPLIWPHMDSKYH